MIRNFDRKKIKSIVMQPNWQAIEDFANQYCDKVRYDSVVRDTEWETIKATLINEGEVRGIKKFMQELMEEVGKTDD